MLLNTAADEETQPSTGPHPLPKFPGPNINLGFLRKVVQCMQQNKTPPTSLGEVPLIKYITFSAEKHLNNHKSRYTF